MSNRVLAIDVLRGVTLFGVILVNAITINGPYFLDTIDFAFKLHWLDEVFSGIVSIFFLEKFYPVFVFLFGLSNQLLLNSLNKKYPSKTVCKIFIKRMLVLSIFGLFHLSLFFWGDVLLVYAILGCLFFMVINNLCRYDLKKIIKINTFLILVTIILNMLVYNFIATDKKYDNYDEYYMNIVIDDNDNIKEITNTYHHGSIIEITLHNLESYYNLFFYGPFDQIDYAIFLSNINYLIELLILMLLGASLSLIPGWYDRIMSYSNQKLYKIILILSVIFFSNEYLQHTDIINLDCFDIIFLLNNITLYLLIFLICFKHTIKNPNSSKYFEYFASIGRMTLTWYLLLSITMSIILYNYGFSLYGKVGVTTCFMIAMAYYYCCYKISYIWLSKFGQGPIEKLWRKLTIPEGNKPQPAIKID